RPASTAAGGRSFRNELGPRPPAVWFLPSHDWRAAAMNRKWSVLAVVTLASSALLVGGLALADDDESPLGKLMNKIQAKENAIKKAVRTPVAWAKAQKDVVAAAEDLAKL